MKHLKTYWAITSLILLANLGYAQRGSFNFNNSSFEDTIAYNYVPYQWINCGSFDETKPDIGPFIKYDWNSNGLDIPPKDGNSFMGLSVGKDGTWEAVGQRLNRALAPAQCYIFSLYMMQPPDLRMRNTYSGAKEAYDSSLVINIWGGNYQCDFDELLASSKPIDNHEWEEYRFYFRPQRRHRFIIIEAYYKSDSIPPYNAYAIIDGATSVSPVSCLGNPPVVTVETTEQPQFAEFYEVADYTFEEIEELIILNGDQIEFNIMQTGITVAGKLALKEIATAMINKDFRIVISLKPGPEQLNYRRRETFRRHLRRFGLKLNGFYVRRLMPSDFHVDWLYEDDFIKIRLKKIWPEGQSSLHANE